MTCVCRETETGTNKLADKLLSVISSSAAELRGITLQVFCRLGSHVTDQFCEWFQGQMYWQKRVVLGHVLKIFFFNMHAQSAARKCTVQVIETAAFVSGCWIPLYGDLPCTVCIVYNCAVARGSFSVKNFFLNKFSPSFEETWQQRQSVVCTRQRIAPRAVSWAEALIYKLWASWIPSLS